MDVPDSFWCLEPESNRHAAFRQAADFKSAVSTNFTIEARPNCETKTGQPRQQRLPGPIIWRRGPESNRPTRICNPVHNRFATAPISLKKKGSLSFPFYKMEREKSLELSTSTLARLRSTN